MRAELLQIAKRTGLGFIVMGFIGFFVKLILCVPLLCSLHFFPACGFTGLTKKPRRFFLLGGVRSIPINNIILQG